MIVPRTSGLEMVKLLTSLSTAALVPPLTHDQRLSVLGALGFMGFTLLCGVFGMAVDSYFYETWARTLSGKNSDVNWKHRERANRVRKFLAYAAMLSFLIGAFAAARYVYLRAPR